MSIIDKIVKVGREYRHFKGNTYRVFATPSVIPLLQEHVTN